MSSITFFPGSTTSMDPIGSDFVDDRDFAAETEARAWLIAKGLLADRQRAATAIPAGDADLVIETDTWELLLCDDEWQALTDDSDPFEEVLSDEPRNRQLARLRVLLNELRESAPFEYRLMAMYWGLDGECVSTIAAIAHKLDEDQAVIESRVLDVMKGLQDALGVKRSGPMQLRIAYTPQRSQPMVLPTRRTQDQPGKRFAA